jgi:hypothetical protein
MRLAAGLLDRLARRHYAKALPWAILPAFRG